MVIWLIIQFTEIPVAIGRHYYKYIAMVMKILLIYGKCWLDIENIKYGATLAVSDVSRMFHINIGPNDVLLDDCKMHSNAWSFELYSSCFKWQNEI